MKKLALFFIFCIVFTLSGCGQVGPLYLPGKKPPVYVLPADTVKHSKQDQVS